MLIYFNLIQEKKPEYPTLTDGMWSNANFLAKNFRNFKNITDDMFKYIKINIEYFREVSVKSINFFA